MPGKFQWRKFTDCSLDDPFFESLKEDYPEFSEWFARKGTAGEEALVFSDESGIGAFVYLKKENEPIYLEGKTLPVIPRLKIGTLKLADRFQGLRLGEGAIYRIYEGQTGKTYRSVITSFCVITKIDVIKDNGSLKVSLPEFLRNAGNKTVFSANELTEIYNRKNTVVMLEMIYNGFFGKGRNVNHKDLNDLGLFYTYPYNIKYSKSDFTKILEMGDKDVQNVIIN